MKRSATILVGLGLVLGLAAFAWAGGGWGYGGGYGHMMGSGYHMGWAGNGGNGWYGPGSMMGWSGDTASNQGPNQGYYCPGWNSYPGDEAQFPQNAPQTSPNPGDQSGR